MALGKTVTNLLSNVTIAANGSSSPSTGVDLSAAVDFGIGYTMTFNASATAGAQILVYADPDGDSASFTVGSYDDPIDVIDIAVDAGHTVSGFAQVQRAPKYVRAVIKNVSATQSITAASIWAHVQTP